MGKGLDTGKTFLQGVLSKITDPGLKAHAEALLGNEVFVTEVGNGVEGQSEISRQLATLRTQQEELTTQQTALDEREQALQTWHGNLSTWHQENKAALDEAKRLRAGGGPTPPTPPAPAAPPPGVMTEDLYNERIAQERAGFLGFSRDQNLIEREHLRKFQELPDIEPLIKHPKIAELGLIGVYQLVHKDRLEKYEADAAKTREDAIRADERQKTLAAQAQMPYPSPTGVGSGSPLDALDAKTQPVVDAAVAHYQRLQQEHAGVGPK